ncbi:uncharacterized protein [Oryza sativa Japonica Group]|jgi:hypothetical protein|uniref:Os11g0664400 protein n=2 Tax=Oryza sativa subsp. japonica TaxID=39947 RepID=Q2QZZ6_ORYSJ|nr:uncharacterized protein LOC107277318 [Oryza sativa Japonica Group]ABA95143.1 hypothetical protein LOC_Os11g44300 [Oryza sativa Japonica Group]EAZ19210.1 hypothetical protein OsJ_34749 [Oryza sativa Japonica Group]KAF2912013.1 hypothetical protein DAI22_11g224100 [Oryza sativa Japonica Group]BAT15162.1 Os11g0664400 [Oryza sativa Japonica Group]
MDSVGAIVKVVQAISKAVSTARRNAASCKELAERAQQVAKILPDSNSKAVARGDATAANILRRLRGALDDALQLVESCQSGGGCLSWPLMLVTGDGLAAKFADVNARISNCLVDLQAANGVRIEEKIDRQAANGSRIEKKLDKLAVAAGSRDQPNQRRANNSSQREIFNTGKNGNNNGGWNKGGGQQQNGGKGGKRRRGKKAAGPPPPPQQPQFRPRAGAGGGVPFYPSMEEDPTSCSVM